jgi:hypothetical protein
MHNKSGVSEGSKMKLPPTQESSTIALIVNREIEVSFLQHTYRQAVTRIKAESYFCFCEQVNALNFGLAENSVRDL